MLGAPGLWAETKEKPLLLDPDYTGVRKQDKIAPQGAVFRKKPLLQMKI